ncbi:MAG TPA: hypothetical protein ENL07_04605 [Chlorobaculum parvum]|uniref:Uncharacterized protein n=1 Tax=Chlorobaculum parvum TaxID=274539 RepID=A0A7C5DGC2_9CHLB|nr:hypothetical protein [Chlorobaculum parvum]
MLVTSVGTYTIFIKRKITLHRFLQTFPSRHRNVFLPFIAYFIFTSRSTLATTPLCYHNALWQWRLKTGTLHSAVTGTGISIQEAMLP